MKVYLNIQDNENKIIIYIQVMHDPLVHDMPRHKEHSFSSVLHSWEIKMSSCQPDNCTKKCNYHNAIKMIIIIFPCHIVFLCGWSLSKRSVLDILFQVASFWMSYPNHWDIFHVYCLMITSDFSHILCTFISSWKSASCMTVYILQIP